MTFGLTYSDDEFMERSGKKKAGSDDGDSNSKSISNPDDDCVGVVPKSIKSSAGLMPDM